MPSPSAIFSIIAAYYRLRRHFRHDVVATPWPLIFSLLTVIRLPCPCAAAMLLFRVIRHATPPLRPF